MQLHAQARGKQAELAAAVRAGLPQEWWGAPAGPDGYILGSRMQMCQVQRTRPHAALDTHESSQDAEEQGRMCLSLCRPVHVECMRTTRLHFELETNSGLFLT
jgi:hypothetical protein